jgi:hypothetical protein
MDAGNFADGMRTLASLRGKTLPPQLAIEVALLETTGSLVTRPERPAVAPSSLPATIPRSPGSALPKYVRPASSRRRRCAPSA